MPELPPRTPLDLKPPFLEQPNLATDRLILRPFLLSDAEDLMQIYSDPVVGRYNAWTPLTELAEARARIELFQRQFAAGERIRWGLELGESGRIIGDCAFVRLEKRGHRGELGFNLAQAFWGKGLMREAVTAVIDYGFREIGLNRIEACVIPENTSSNGLLKRLRFQREGLMRQAGVMKGAYIDVDLWSLLFEDFYGQDD